MLIISHDHDIIRKSCLFRAVIKTAACGRYIVVHRKNQSVIRAFQRKFADKLDISVSYRAFQRLEIHIHAVKVILDRQRNDLVDQILTLGSMCQHLCGAGIRIFQVTDQSPYFHSVLVAVIYIIKACQRCHISVAVIQIKPGRGDNVHSLGRGKHTCNFSVRIHIGHLMPAHVDRRILFDMCKFLGISIGYGSRCYRLGISDKFCLYISDNAILRSDLAPGISRFDHRKVFTFFDLF